MSAGTLLGRDAPSPAGPDESTIGRLAASARRRIARATHDPRVQQAATVLAVLAVLELVVFYGYLNGTYAPAPDDFIGSYNNEPWAWWRDATPTDWPDWVPYAWGGYPAAVSLQSGSWYLPLGLASLLGPFTIHAAAILQALTVGFGALGAYVLGRTWRLHHLAAMLGLVAYFFAVGAYSNALHPDIVRGFAFAPWLLLCLSPYFPWRRWWSVPVAALVLWQTVVGAYPGVTVALAYCGIVLVVTFQVTGRHRVREYLLPLGFALVGAALLCVPKYLTALQLSGMRAPNGDLDESVFSLRMLGTLFFPYDYPWLPNDLSMRSFFVVAPCLVLLVLLRRRGSAALAPVVAFGATALVLGMPWWPWWEVSRELPGLSLSRFRMSDFRVPLVLAAVALAMIATSGALRSPAALTRRGRVVRLALLALIPVGAAAIAELGGYPAADWSTPWMILAGSAVLVVVLGSLAQRALAIGPGRERVAALALVILAAISGVDWAYATMPPWRQERVPIEVGTWGASSGDFIAEFDDPAGVRRPPRTPLDDAVAPPTDVFWNTSFYDGQDAVGGYVNLRGTPAFGAALSATTSTDPTTYLSSRSMLAAPGLGIAVRSDSHLPTQELIESCAATNVCGPDLSVEPVAYDVGQLSYQVKAAGPTRILFNEAYYPGWQVEACRPGSGYCRDLPVRMGGAGLLLTELPVAGTWDLTLTYETPGRTRDVLALVLGLVVVFVPASIRRHQRRAGTAGQTSAHRSHA